MIERILDRLLDLRDKDADRVAAVVLQARPGNDFHETPLTYGSWMREAAAVALALREAGIGAGDRVLVCLPTSAEFLHAFCGALWLGAIPVPLPSIAGFAHPQAFFARLRSVIGDAQPRALVADADTRRHLDQSEPSWRRRIILPQLPAVGECRDAEERISPCRAPLESPAFLQYTSGSTGDPKGIVVTQGNLAANVVATGQGLGLVPEDRVLVWLPLYHDMGLIGGLLVPAFHNAQTFLLRPIDFLLQPATWPQALARYRATVTGAPNFAYSILARKVSERDLGGVDLSSLRVALNASEPVDPGTERAFARRYAPFGFRDSAYLPVYGLAEATLSVSFPPLDRGIRIDTVRREDVALRKRLDTVPASESGAISFVSCGRAVARHTILIADETTGAPLPERQLGQIVVCGPSVSPRDFDPARSDGQPRTTLETGDLGYLADGELYVVGRIKDLIIVAGRCYAPSDIEEVVDNVQGVRRGRAVAFGAHRHGEGTDRLVVVAEVNTTLTRGAKRIEQDIARAVTRAIGLTPGAVVLVWPRSLARTSSGKIMRSSAHDRFARGELNRFRARSPLHPSGWGHRLSRLRSAVLAAVLGSPVGAAILQRRAKKR